jgi:hypothetical protein
MIKKPVAWGLIAVAGLTCAGTLFAWRNDEFLWPEHTHPIHYLASMPVLTRAVIQSTASVSITHLGDWLPLQSSRG